MAADDAPKVQDEMVRTISRTLGARLSGEGEARNPAVDPEAYRLYLKGRMLLAGTPDELLQATAFFQQAIERDPLYAAAHAALAESYAIHAHLLSDNREEIVRKARAAIRRALEIAPDLAEALAVSGLIRLYFDWDLPGAEADLKLARQPPSPRAGGLRLAGRGACAAGRGPVASGDDPRTAERRHVLLDRPRLTHA